MSKIASPQELQKELNGLLAKVQGPNPSREKLSSELRDLASRITKSGADQYKTLADAAGVTGNPKYGQKGAVIWYWKGRYGRDLMMGYDFVMKHSPELLEDVPIGTHEVVGTVGERNPNRVYDMMQGEVWSPNGEARAMIMRKGLDHTSMSVGDVVQIGRKFFFVDKHGFEVM